MKPPPCSFVGLPVTTVFQKCIAIDFKFYKENVLLNLIDHATQLSLSIFVKLKEPNAIINCILKCWIKVYGAPKKKYDI